MNNLGFIEERHKEIQVEIDELRLRFAALREQHSQAETLLRFYANPTNYFWRNAEDGFVYQDMLSCDVEESSNSKTMFIAGARARQYFEKQLSKE